MKLSTRSEYGVRAMVDLAAAHGKGPTPLSQIAEKEGISLDYLEQLMTMLRKKGLVKSARGMRGGYILALSPERISVGDVIWTLEGPFVPIFCLEISNEEQPDCCSLRPECTTRSVWVKLRDKVTETLNSVTLADLSRSPERFLNGSERTIRVASA